MEGGAHGGQYESEERVYQGDESYSQGWEGRSKCYREGEQLTLLESSQLLHAIHDR